MGSGISFKNLFISFSYCLNWVAGIALVAMVVVNMVNIFGRLFFNSPFRGTYEISEFLGAAIGAFAMGWTMVQGGHVSIDVLVSRLSRRSQAVIDAFVGLLGMAIFSLLTWQTAVFATELMQTGQLSMGLRVPYYPVVYGVAFGCAVITLVLVIRFLDSLKAETKKWPSQ